MSEIPTPTPDTEERNEYKHSQLEENAGALAIKLMEEAKERGRNVEIMSLDISIDGKDSREEAPEEIE